MIYFGTSFIFQLSPVTKAIVIFLGSAGFFVGGISISKNLLDTILYIISTSSYLVFITYTLYKFTPSQELVLISFAASSALFIVLGYLIRRNRLDINWREGKKILLVILVLAFVLLGADLAGAQPSYEVRLRDSVNLTQGKVNAGYVDVSNPFWLPRDTDVPFYEACISDGGSQVELEVESMDSEVMGGGKSEKLNISIYSRSSILEDEKVSGEFKLEFKSECPGSFSENKIIVYSDEDELD